MKIFNQYIGLRREIYVLFFGRVVTCLGAMIHPLLTLILSNKLHMDAASIASMMLVLSVVQFPATYIAGYLADHYNKRNIIIVCDLVTVICYMIAGYIDMSLTTIVLICIASLFASMEHPVYDALIADMSCFEQREAAYSLNYLGVNLGIILAPSLGGLLFASHLNIAFYIDGISTALSTLLIYFFIKDVTVVQSENEQGIYESEKERTSVLQVLKERKIIIYFIICSMLSEMLYSQFNFLMPLNFEQLYKEKGAILYGTLTSLNGLVVVFATPLLTSLCAKTRDIHKLIYGVTLMTLSFSMYIVIQGMIPLYYISMIIFTIGEIYNTLGARPYLTRRIPSTHRGRIASLSRITVSLCVAILQKGFGYLIDHQTMITMWKIVTIIGIVTIICICILRYYDQKSYPLLYKEKNV